MLIRLTTILLLFLASLAGAQTVHTVDAAGSGSFTTIQAAIVASVSGDTVEVAPGTYHEMIDFLGKEITVEASGSGGAAAHVIDGQGAGSTVSLVNGEGTGAVLDGFTVTGGVGHGGGIRMENASALIVRCHISLNQGTVGDAPVLSAPFGLFSSAGGAGGIHVQGGAPTIVDCLVQGNTGGQAGPIAVGTQCIFPIFNPFGSNCTPTTFYGSAAPGGAGGISCVDAEVTIRDCRIVANTGGDEATNTLAANLGRLETASAGPGGVLRWRSHQSAHPEVRILDSILEGNVAGAGEFAAAAIATVERSDPMNGFAWGDLLVERSTIHNHGGPVTIFAGGRFEMRSCRVTSNSGVQVFSFCPNTLGHTNRVDHCSFSGVDSVFNAPSSNSGAIAVSNSVIWGYTDITAPVLAYGSMIPSVAVDIASSCIENLATIPGSILSGSDNIGQDPLFVDPAANDYRLMPSSPCIDAGDPITSTGGLDHEGDPRSFYAAPDMGQDEFVSSCFAGQGQGAGLLSANGEAGAEEQVVAGPSLTLAIDQPATNPIPAPFVIWGMIGAPSRSGEYPTPIGDLCFTPYHVAPSVPTLFVLANSAFADTAALAPASPGAWALTIPATVGASGLTLTLQGIVEEQPGIWTTTNGIVVEFQ